jgi:uncharacterized membrane protein YccC
MIPLSARAKEAIKAGLAMVIAFGIALGMDWDDPHWAGISVAMISLTTAGQSLNKGAMRLLGTLVAVIAAFTFLSLFPQDRWLMTLVLSLYVGVFTYMLTGKRFPYFWFVSAFVCLIIVVEAGNTSESAFHIAMERTLETALGILVYALVAALLWPQSSRGDLEHASRKLLAVQNQLYGSYRALMGGQGVAEDSRPLRMEEVQLVHQVGQALNAAETDSYIVWEVRHQWRRFRDETTDLGEALERWRESFPEVRGLDLAKLLPNLDAVCAELEARFAEIERMLAGEAPGRQTQPIALEVDRASVRMQSHFERAAVAVTKAQLDRLEALTRSLFEVVQDIKGFAVEPVARCRGSVRPRGLAIDPDRFTAAIRVMATVWAAFLLWVYVDPPGHATFVQLSGTIAMAAAMMSMNRPSTMLLPFAFGCLLAGVLYVFVMPKLSGYWELGLMIFGATFAIYYLFSAPRQALAKMGAIIPVIVLTSIQNQQSYDFARYANSAVMILLAITLVVVMAHIPTSPRPEKIFLRLFRRFFRQADYLLSRMALDWEQTKGATGRWKTMLYRNDLWEIPAKLRAVGPQIDHRQFPDNTPEQVQALVNSLSALTFRIMELGELRERPQAKLLVQELLGDVRAWRLAIQEQIRLWADDPEAAARQQVDIQQRVTNRLASLETRIEETFGKAGDGELSDQDRENFYQLLGAWRGLSEAGVNFVHIANGINWAQWREARF